MKSFIKYSIIFAAGVVSGLFLSKTYYREQYKTRINKDLEALNSSSPKEKTDAEKTKEDLEEYKKLLKIYKNLIPEDKDIPRKGGSSMESYIIEPENYGEYPDYEKVELVYFHDGHLTDENYEEIEDCDFLPDDFVDHFGEYESECVYTRNDQKKCDYMVVLDFRDFDEV